MRSTLWQPRYSLTANIARGPMAIEAAKAVVERTPLSSDVEAELRRRARLRSTHYSTRIEGNRLTLAETEQVIESARRFRGRERDVREVQYYWNALTWVETQAAKRARLTEGFIRKLHALVEYGSRARPTPYRDGQNVIRDSITHDIIYLPPEANDVPNLMSACVRWITHAELDDASIPIIAGLAHYQFVTIHPFYDGNGRTARLLATFILHRGGYGLNGLISVEEQHALDLDRYYAALVTHPHHNYYEGRADADLTNWLAYFIHTLTQVFAKARDEALRASGDATSISSHELLIRNPRARIVLGLFKRQPRITSADVATALGLSARMARVLLAGWVADGWLEIADASKRNRAYVLAAQHRLEP